MIEPLYSLEVACELIPITRGNMMNLLFHYSDRFPARYNQEVHPAVRMLTETECLEIRNIIIKLGNGKYTKGLRRDPGLPITKWGRTLRERQDLKQLGEFLGVRRG